MLWMMKVSSLYLREFGNKNFNGPISNWHKTNIIYQHDQNLIMTPNNKLSYEEERSIYYDNIFLFSRKCHAIFHHRLTLWRFFFLKSPVLQHQQPTSHPAIFEKSQTKTIDFFPPISVQTKKTYNICLYQFLWVNIYLIYYPYL